MIKNEEKRTLQKTHHTISTSIDLIENDINALMKQLTKKLKSNLTHDEYIVMEELAERSTKL